jgi:glycerol-3-phosphate dehydrogenase
MDEPKHKSRIAPSQGIHLVVDATFLPGAAAIMIPKTDDGRVLFAVPWHNKIVLGTTDTPIKDPLPEPIALKEEIDFILKHIGRYLSKDPQLSDVKSIFAGLRPLVKGKTKTTAALSRDHLVSIGRSGLISITGGKWTTYRKMAEDVINTAAEKNSLPSSPCVTKELKIFGHDRDVIPATSLAPQDIILTVKEEMCMTVEDYLARRTRHLFLDARAAIAAAPLVARHMAAEMNKDQKWIDDQVQQFTTIAKEYLPI